MKIRLLKRIRSEAEYRAHIIRLSCETNAFGTCVGRSVSIGYGISEEAEDYKGLYHYGMTVDDYNWVVLKRYWELHRDYYYSKYRKYRKKKNNKNKEDKQ